MGAGWAPSTHGTCSDKEGTTQGACIPSKERQKRIPSVRARVCVEGGGLASARVVGRGPAHLHMGGATRTYMHAPPSPHSSSPPSPDQVSAAVDESLRRRVRANHTATHLLQSALKKVLGQDTCQQGSLVSFDRLRCATLPRPGRGEVQGTRAHQCPAGVGPRACRHVANG